MPPRVPILTLPKSKQIHIELYSKQIIEIPKSQEFDPIQHLLRATVFIVTHNLCVIIMH